MSLSVGMDALYVDRVVIDEIVAHCRHEYPHEACGIVAGAGGIARRVYPLANVSPDPLRRYLIDAKEQKAVVQTMRAVGETPMAVFHSHPRTDAHPSDVDIDMAYDPQLTHIIVSLAGPEPEVRAFRIDRATRTVTSVSLLVATA